MEKDFFYTKIPSSCWEEELSFFSNKNQETLVLTPCWADHEKSQGICDFTRYSNLRLEKLLRLAQSLSISVAIRIGFPPHFDFIPNWIHQDKEIDTVPCLNFTTLGLTTVSLPSLRNKKFLNTFLEYVREIFELIKPYEKPNGPVEKVFFDPGLYEVEQPDLEKENIKEIFLETFFQSYQRDPNKINLIYQTHFSEKTLTTLNSFTLRALFDKRSWIFAHDFKQGRKRLLKKVEEKLFTLYGGENWEEFPFCVKEKKIESEFHFFLDNTFLEKLSYYENPFFTPVFFPFSPPKIRRESLQIAQELWQEIVVRNFSISFFHSLSQKEIDSFSDKKRIFVSIQGRFLNSQWVSWFESLFERNFFFFFPFGLPTLNEKLEAISWGEEIKTTKFCSGVSVSFRKIKNSLLAYPNKPFSSEEGLNWIKLENILWEMKNSFKL